MAIFEMDLGLNPSLGDRYKSQAQKTRVISEGWAEKNAFCCSCGGALEKSCNNAHVLDFKCIDCQGEFELKSTRGRFCHKHPDGAFHAMMARLHDTSSPNFFFLAYDLTSCCVKRIFSQSQLISSTQL